MTQVIRPLLPVVASALLLTAAFILWIRGEPLDLASPVQVALSILLVLAVVVLGAAVLWVERDDARPAPSPLQAGSRPPGPGASPVAAPDSRRPRRGDLPRPLSVSSSAPP
jgi:hypothetical protein